MTDERFFDLAVRYVSGAATAQEIEHMQVLLTEEHYADLFRRVNEVWLAGGKAILRTEFDANRGYERLAEKMRKHEPLVRWGPNRRRFPVAAPRMAYVAMAGAVMLVVLLFGIRFYDLHRASQGTSIAWNEKSTRMGEKLVLTLPDRSIITLNGGSTVKYPSQFADGARTVYLEGEAYFEVIHDPAHQFIVHAGAVSTTDLGTKFTISAYPADADVAVSLDEGSVEVADERTGSAPAPVVLSPSQQFLLNRSDGSHHVGKFDPRRVSGWRENRFVFDNERLSSVFAAMERAFGVRFETADPTLAQRRIKAEFHNETVWTVAEIIKKATGVPYHAETENNSLKKIIFAKN
jgi:ferric-dicitrate binding protein FerR (iron transport regulator)